MVLWLRIMQRGGALCLLSAFFASGTLPHTRGNIVYAGAATPAAPLSPPAQHPNVRGSAAPAKRPAGAQGSRFPTAAPQGHAPSAGDPAKAFAESRQQQGKTLPPTAPHLPRGVMLPGLIQPKISLSALKQVGGMQKRGGGRRSRRLPPGHPS